MIVYPKNFVMSTLTRITARAKKLYKKGKAGISWVAAIKRASVQIKKARADFREGYTDRAAKYRPYKAKKSKRKRRISGIVQNPKLLAANVGKGPTIQPTRTYVKVPTVAGIRGTPNYLTFENVNWHDVKAHKLPFKMKGGSFYTLKGQKIFWAFSESRQAQNWLKKNRIKDKI